MNGRNAHETVSVRQMRCAHQIASVRQIPAPNRVSSSDAYIKLHRFKNTPTKSQRLAKCANKNSVGSLVKTHEIAMNVRHAYETASLRQVRTPDREGSSDTQTKLRRLKSDAHTKAATLR